jgi:hypothetical protein
MPKQALLPFQRVFGMTGILYCTVVNKGVAQIMIAAHTRLRAFQKGVLLLSNSSLGTG